MTPSSQPATGSALARKRFRCAVATVDEYGHGLAHSPFECDFLCCAPELAPIAVVYFHVESNLDGTVLDVDGAPYVALDPDRRCN